MDLVFLYSSLVRICVARILMLINKRCAYAKTFEIFLNFAESGEMYVSGSHYYLRERELVETNEMRLPWKQIKTEQKSGHDILAGAWSIYVIGDSN